MRVSGEKDGPLTETDMYMTCRAHVRPCVVVSVLARLRFLKTSQRKLSCVFMKLLSVERLPALAPGPLFRVVLYVPVGKIFKQSTHH